MARLIDTWLPPGHLRDQAPRIIWASPGKVVAKERKSWHSWHIPLTRLCNILGEALCGLRSGDLVLEDC
eukprot:12901617-Prorocentrum_lima.AAC.1